MRTAIRIPPALTVFVIAAAVVMTAPAAVLAFPPTADAGGPYTIAEGEALTLDGSGSFDPDLDPLTYEWDIDNQGTWADVTGVSPTLTWAQLQSYGVDDDGSYQIVLRV
ncbi:MAG: hypothetical protein KAJ17_06145, partial [Candidatus Krumholzibacteria bacterium]|nr:hypothetical protein [Candidatus Krumholzibacteria bacterium]